MTRRVGEPVKAGQRYVRRPGIYALLPRGYDLLVTFQEQPKPEFQLPGGGIDPGEQPMAALHREVVEETGWRIAPIRRLGFFRRFTYMREYDLWAEKVCTVVLAKPIHQLGPPIEPGHSAVWLKVDEALELLGNGGDVMFAGQALKGAR
ncbi:NUDIX domain-containing protein [Vannielia sp. SX4]|uniref:NUDIX domain-containing protein n=1 Tax=Vannielia sp. SX4 TaxID=3463852 RepID=UPI0040599F57